MTENRTRLAALAALRKLVPPELELAELRTFPGNAPPPYKTAAPHSRRRQPVEEDKTKEQKVMIISGRAPGLARGELTGTATHELIEQFESDIREARGPLGNKLFSKAAVKYARVEEGAEAEFEIEIELAEEEGDEV